MDRFLMAAIESEPKSTKFDWVFFYQPDVFFSSFVFLRRRPFCFRLRLVRISFSKTKTLVGQFFFHVSFVFSFLFCCFLFFHFGAILLPSGVSAWALLIFSFAFFDFFILAFLCWLENPKGNFVVVVFFLNSPFFAPSTRVSVCLCVSREATSWIVNRTARLAAPRDAITIFL